MGWANRLEWSSLCALFVRHWMIWLQVCCVSCEHNGMIQTLIVTQNGALHLMPLCEFNQGNAMLMRLPPRCCCDLAGSYRGEKKIRCESKYRRSQRIRKEEYKAKAHLWVIPWGLYVISPFLDTDGKQKHLGWIYSCLLQRLQNDYILAAWSWHPELKP